MTRTFTRRPKIDILKHLEQYTGDQIDLVQDFINTVNSIKVFDLNGNNIVELDPSDEIEDVRDRYITVGIGEGIIDSEAQFDDILKYLTKLQ